MAPRLAAARQLRRARRTLLGAVLAVAALGFGRQASAWLPGAASRPAAAREPRAEGAAAAAASGIHDGPSALPSRRAGCAAAAVAALLALSAAVPSARADWKVMNVLPPVPPKPDPIPYVRALQKKSWAMEPFSRQRLYLKAVSQRMGVGMFNAKYFVHWSADSYKYDVLDQKPWEEAKANGKILLDSDMCDAGSETVVFIYAKPEDKKWVEDNVGVSEVIECPEELVKAIEIIKATPFPES